MFVGLTAWAGITNPWLAPGFAALAAAQLVLVIAAWRNVQVRQALFVLLAWMSLWYLGIAYVASLLAGTPQTKGFWAAFGACLAILGPAVVLAQRFLFREWRAMPLKQDAPDRSVPPPR